MYSLVEENYLKALYNISHDKGSVSVNDLSVDLGLKMPTVNSMVKKMAEKGLVVYEKYKPLNLTANGKKAAGLIVRKHRLTEMYLVDVMGFGWEQVHEIAEQIEHIQSPLFFDRMEQILGFPTVDPHGSPIPDKNGDMPLNQFIALQHFTLCDFFQLKSVVNGSKEFLEYLNEKNIILDTVFEIVKIEKFDQSMQVKYNNQLQVLSPLVTANLWGIKVK
jgi:DtxR family Mn-dependent transcriptional regulator